MKTINELAKELKVHPNTVYRWIYQGKMKVFKVGKTIRIPDEEVQKYLRNLKKVKEVPND